MRSTDQQDGKAHFRSDERIFCLNGSWYFQTREHDHGPYGSREMADHELQRYVSEMEYFATLTDDQIAVPPVNRPKPTTTDDLKLLDPGEY